MTDRGSLVVIAGLLLLAAQPGCTAGRAGPPPPNPTPLEIEQLTADASVAHARRIAPLDLLQVTVFEVADLTRAVRVSADGDISLPLVGLVRAAGATPRELEKALAEKLRTYMHEPHVAVVVTESATQPVYVLGEVNEPGAFTPGLSDSGMTLLRAVSLAGGFSRSAANSRTVVIRTGPSGERVQIPVNLDHVLRGAAADFPLVPNDVVYVPKNTERAVALGVVDALLRVVTFRTVF